MVRHDDESDDSRALTPSSDPASLDLLRKILVSPREDAALDAPPDAENLQRLLADPRFQELIEIVNLAVQVHGSKARDWFARPEPELGFVLPATLLRDPANGRKLVKQSLMNHLRGVYALGQDERVLPKIRPVIVPAPGPELPRARKTRLAKPSRKPDSRRA